MILPRQPWQQLPFGLRLLPKDKKKKMRESQPRNKGPVSYAGARPRGRHGPKAKSGTINIPVCLAEQHRTDSAGKLPTPSVCPGRCLCDGERGSLARAALGKLLVQDSVNSVPSAELSHLHQKRRGGEARCW